MKLLIEDIKKEIDSMKFHIDNYKKWIAECKQSGNDYGVESYTVSKNELTLRLRDYTAGLKILKHTTYGKGGNS